MTPTSSPRQRGWRHGRCPRDRRDRAARPTRTRTPGTPPAGKTPRQILRRCRCRRLRRADQQRRRALQRCSARTDRACSASYDAINPVTGGGRREHHTKPGCSDRPAQRRQRRRHGDPAQPEEHGRPGRATASTWSASSRAKGTAAAEADLTFYAQSRDAVGYAVIGNAYAPTDAADHGAAQGHLRVHRSPTGARSAGRRVRSTSTCRRPPRPR